MVPAATVRQFSSGRGAVIEEHTAQSGSGQPALCQQAQRQAMAVDSGCV